MFWNLCLERVITVLKCEVPLYETELQSLFRKIDLKSHLSCFLWKHYGHCHRILQSYVNVVKLKEVERSEQVNRPFIIRSSLFEDHTFFAAVSFYEPFVFTRARGPLCMFVYFYLHCFDKCFAQQTQGSFWSSIVLGHSSIFVERSELCDVS